ncbi:MAG: hypothetical protein Q4D91_09390 [Lautropia sp.]|nr:hypothetical protein [Lautropia sp.]
MNLFIELLEIFLPELMSAMSGASSIPLANRFKRVAYGLFALALLYAVLRLAWWFWVGHEPGDRMEDLLARELPVMFLLVVMGFVALSLSRRALLQGAGKAQVHGAASRGEAVSSKDMAALDEWVSAVAAGYELRLSRPFSPSSPSHYRRQSRVSWLRMASALKGQVPLETWRLEVEGIPLEFSFYAGAECFRLREQGGEDEVRGTIIPGERAAMRVMLVDQAGSVRELDLMPQPSLRYQLLVFVDAVPITFRR